MFSGYSPKRRKTVTQGEELLNKLCYYCFLCAQKVFSIESLPLPHHEQHQWSDCDPPSDRDVYIQGLVQHIQVDSYGQCLHNKDLPPHLRDSTAMDDHDFYQILAQYKFILAFENAVCDDYITEQLWRPLKVGVTTELSTPNVCMWLPDNRSAVVVNPNEPPKKLAQCLNRLDKNDWEYLKYLEWKQKREISNVNLVTELNMWGCMVCNRVWENIHRQEKCCPCSTTRRPSAAALTCPSPRSTWRPSTLSAHKHTCCLCPTKTS
uniref:Fucosyltransferase n=1 Tax=Sinocyclocheilus anshuiensis TaxID=1608454 RepID=A0A671S7W4_9TELE